jgi:ribosome biogenesis GTPase / thiamine phosphate phosphatase
VTGLVVSGSKNMFIVRMDDGAELECRLKGKVLKGVEGFYNPLAPGDRVVVETDTSDLAHGLVTALEERRNVFSRWNQKGKAPQLLAANLDILLCVVAPSNPPFRPRFIDRVLLQADVAGIPPVIVLNKCDLEEDDPDIAERLEDYIRLGYRVLRVSTLTGEGIEELRELLGGRFSAMVGQSGVGKSSLLNALAPDLDLRVGDMCEKFDRGSHTTTMARLLVVDAPRGGARIIDTPGVRRLVPDGIGANQLALHLREFAPLVGRCTYGMSCSHTTEPGCKILEAVAAGVIHEDRYESFLRIRDELEGRVPSWEQD